MHLLLDRMEKKILPQEIACFKDAAFGLFLS